MLEFDASLLGWRSLRAEVTVALRVGGVLWRGLALVVLVTVVGLLVCRLARWRRTGRRSHPCCAGVWLSAVRAASASVEAAASQEVSDLIATAMEPRTQPPVPRLKREHSRKSKEDEKCDRDDNCKGYPTTPAVPGAAPTVIVIVPLRASFLLVEGSTL